MNRVKLIALLACALTTGMLQAHQNDMPPMPPWQTDARHCDWVWREGGGLGLWTETCSLQGRQWDVVWDEMQTAFVSRRDGEVAAALLATLASGGDSH